MPVARTYDATFEQLRQDIPIAFLRALAMRESSLNPRSQVSASDSSAKGLFQITGVVRKDYNRIYSAAVGVQDLFDPTMNTRIAVDLLRRIKQAYERYHPSQPNMQTDWRNLRFVELLVAGWNGGWSEGGGVGRVAKFLAQSGSHIDVDLVVANAARAGAIEYLSDSRRMAWWKSVAKLYDQERLGSAFDPSDEGEPVAEGSGPSDSDPGDDGPGKAAKDLALFGVGAAIAGLAVLV